MVADGFRFFGGRIFSIRHPVEVILFDPGFLISDSEDIIDQPADRPSSAHFNGHTHCTCCPWWWHVSSCLTILPLAFSSQSCGKESAPVQPYALVFKKAAQCQTWVQSFLWCLGIRAAPLHWPPAAAAWGLSFTLIKAMTCPAGWLREVGPP